MSILILAIAYPAAIAVLFYLAFYRPVQQQQKRQRQEMASLQVGDEVLTQGGLIAVIKEIRIPEEQGPTALILDPGGLDGQAMRVGLDLKGGTNLLLKAALSQLPSGTNVDDAMDGAKNIIERRVN